MANENALTKTKILSELGKSVHGKLEAYLPICQEAALKDGEFFAHLLCWDASNGQIRDAHLALPVISLSVAGLHQEFISNAWAHLAKLGPRDLLRATVFAREKKLISEYRLRCFVARYLLGFEQNRGTWTRVALQHRDTLRKLYRRFKVHRPGWVDSILFNSEYPAGSVWDAIKNLYLMSPVEAAGTILQHKIPFLTARAALREKAKHPDVVMALIKSMSPSELVNNTAALEKLGLKTTPALRAAFEEGLKKAATSKKNTFKATRAVGAVSDDGLKQKLRDLQENQIASLAGVDGNWLVLGDKSGSMSQAIDLAVLISATLAKMVKGEVNLVFFDTAPRGERVTGLTYEQIVSKTRHIRAGGGTSIGCGLLYAVEKQLPVDGIAIISDGEENTPPLFVSVYVALCQSLSKSIPVYFYRTVGGISNLGGQFKAAGVDLQEFDCTDRIDYYSLPNLAATMRTNRYSLVDEVMATKLLRLEDVMPQKVPRRKKKKGERYVAAVEVV
jgi:hypothetical protein